jgi:hypothetical protein
MKWEKLLLVLSILAFMSSCQSEYERQVAYAKKLVKKERELIHRMSEIETISTSYTTLESIKNELSIRAHLSGNEELFNEQVANYRTDYDLKVEKERQIMISKFP